MWIAKQIDDVLEGHVKLEDAKPSVRSCIRLHIYNMACDVLEKPKPERRSEIDAKPESIRKLLEDEIIRIWRLRKEGE